MNQISRWTRLRENWRAYRQAPRERIGFWFGLLLLFAPVFYVLLWMRPYSVAARTGWGIWVGFLVFVKLSGLSDPLLVVPEDEPQEAGAAYAPASPDGAEERERIRTDPQMPSLESYLQQLGGGMLGAFLDSHKAEGELIQLRFRAHDGFFSSREDIALLSIGAAFSLMEGRGYRRVVLDYSLHGTPVRLELERGAFAAFFGLEEDDLSALAADHARFEQSPLRTLSPEGQRAFWEHFAGSPPP